MARWNNSQRGAVMAETAIGAVIFMMVTVGILDFGRVLYYRSNLKHAVSQSVRFAITGNSLEDPDSPGNRLSREASIIRRIRQLSGIDVNESDVEIASVDSSGRFHSGAGGPGDVVTVRVSHTVELFAPYIDTVLPDGLLTFTTTTSFRNEEFNVIAAGTTGGGASVARRSRS